MMSSTIALCIIYSLFCKLHTSDRLIILHIDCILVFIVCCFLFVFSLYHSLMNKVAQNVSWICGERTERTVNCLVELSYVLFFCYHIL